MNILTVFQEAAHPTKGFKPKENNITKKKKTPPWKSTTELRAHIYKTNTDSPQFVSVILQNLICKSVVYNSEYTFTKQIFMIKILKWQVPRLVRGGRQGRVTLRLKEINIQ